MITTPKSDYSCLAEGSLVLTRDGFKPIENVKAGDYVLTHMGNWKPVLASVYAGEKEIMQIKATGVPNLFTTPEQKLWARTPGTYPSRPKNGMRADIPNWREAKDMENCYVNLKLPPIEAETDLFHLDDDAWWLIGRYLADGHRGTRGDYFISVGNKKRDEFESRAKRYIGTKADRKGCKQYRLKDTSNFMKKLLVQCGCHAETKQVPIIGLCLPNEFSEALLSGYISGDGNKTGNLVSATSVSRALLLGMAMVAQRARGVIASVYAGKPARESIIEGRTVLCRQEWIMCWRENGGHREGDILPDGAWKKTRKPAEISARNVYSIQIEDDESYTAEGCIVKS